MSGLSITRRPDGSVRMAHLTPWSVAMLLEVEGLLDPNQPESVRRRLYPEPGQDAELKKDWERYVHPDLFALVATAREIVARDLETIELPRAGDPDHGTGWRLVIAPDHVQAWLSALNSARLTLAELHTVGEDELEGTDFDLLDEKALAVAKIRLYGWIQQLILEAEDPDIDASS